MSDRETQREGSFSRVIKDSLTTKDVLINVFSSKVFFVFLKSTFY